MLHLDEEFPPGVCPWLVALCGEDVAHAEDRTPGRAIYRNSQSLQDTSWGIFPLLRLHKSVN